MRASSRPWAQSGLEQDPEGSKGLPKGPWGIGFGAGGGGRLFSALCGWRRHLGGHSIAGSALGLGFSWCFLSWAAAAGVLECLSAFQPAFASDSEVMMNRER
jgi:hypothetical protein